MLRYFRLLEKWEIASRAPRVRLVGLLLLAAAVAPLSVRADNARFDLIGPKVDVRITRGGVTLPIASVPNLQPGDRLWLHPDLPPTQSVRYLMVLAFLRGTTNPPPDNWFIRIETWDKKVRDEGIEVTVPDEAEQAVLFLAPVTGGDFGTLRSAVQGRPGIFVRAAQDLAAAGFEQARIETYIASMRQVSPTEAADPKQLQERSNLIAAALALKPNGDCIKLPPDQQYTCLTQSGNQMLLDDGHGQSIVDALTGNASAGLIDNASATQLAGGGLYSAYVGTIVDLVHIMGSLHTAQYQYIPAIAFPQQQALNLRLNTPPSFHNPKSVIVIGLPSIQQTIPPPLRASNPQLVSCLAKPGVVLPVEGAPLVFSTGFAHDLVLHLNYPAGTRASATEPQDVPLTAEAFEGGLALAPVPKRRALPVTKVSLPTSPVSAGSVSGGNQPGTDGTGADGTAAPTEAVANPIENAELTGTVEGGWGFDTFTGPTMPLQQNPGKDWKLASDGAGNGLGSGALIAGKDQHILLSSTGAACIQSISLDSAVSEPKNGASGKQDKDANKASWKIAEQPNTVDVALNLPAHESGPLHLAIRQFGDLKPATVSLVTYKEPAKLTALQYHAGDTHATLSGTGLDQVTKVDFGALSFIPADGSSDTDLDLSLQPGATSAPLRGGVKLAAQVALRDGRTLPLSFTVGNARPAVNLIGKAAVPADSAPAGELLMHLGGATDLPVGDALLFSLKSAQPFPRRGEIEIGSPDGSLSTTLSVSNGLVLEDPTTLLGTLQPLKAFGSSAFGPIRLRAVAPDGTAGDWVPLVTLVRLPTLAGLSCPVAAPAKPAVLPAPQTSTAPVDSISPDASVPANKAAAATPGAVGGASAPAPGAASSTPSPPPALCTLTGNGLYFLDSVATDAAFTKPTLVPAGFMGASLAVPPPTGALYYLRLRDDPTVIDTVTLPAGPL